MIYDAGSNHLFSSSLFREDFLEQGLKLWP